jgi:hypothetical protein
MRMMWPSPKKLPITADKIPFMRTKLLIAFFLCLQFVSRAEQDSSGLRISLLTCTPGAELYSIFGHNALRVIDSAAGTDVVYNYGTFNFNDPDFYTKFVRGKLMYFLSQSSYPDFLFEYSYFKRGIVEQELKLSAEEKKELQQFMFENVREENRHYKYDFLYDNCTTRLRDIIFRVNGAKPLQPRVFSIYGKTFRDNLHDYLDRAQMPWTTLGIDLLLGVGADKPMSPMEVMFLPDYLAKGISIGTAKGKQLVLKENIALADAQDPVLPVPFWQQPLFVIGIISLVLFITSILGSSKWQRFADNVSLIVTGMLGFLLLFMWLGTDHQSFSKNLNLVWAMPINLVLAFVSDRRREYVRKYFNVYSVLLIILMAVGILYDGVINFSLFPIIVLLSYRSWVLSRPDKKMLNP